MIPPMSRDRFNTNVDRKVKTEAKPSFCAGDDRATAPAEAAAPVAEAPLIEIVLGGGTVRTHGAVDAQTLATVLRAVKAAT